MMCASLRMHRSSHPAARVTARMPQRAPCHATLLQDALGGLLELGADGLGVGTRGALGEEVRLDLGLGAGRTEDDLVVVLEAVLDDVGGGQGARWQSR